MGRVLTPRCFVMSRRAPKFAIFYFLMILYLRFKCSRKPVVSSFRFKIFRNPVTSVPASLAIMITNLQNCLKIKPKLRPTACRTESYENQLREFSRNRTFLIMDGLASKFQKLYFSRYSILHQFVEFQQNQWSGFPVRKFLDYFPPF